MQETFLAQQFVPIMFITLFVILLSGFPVAFGLAATGLGLGFASGFFTGTGLLTGLGLTTGLGFGLSTGLGGGGFGDATGGVAIGSGGAGSGGAG